MDIVKRISSLLLAAVCSTAITTQASQGKDYALSKLITMSSDSRLVVKHLNSYKQTIIKPNISTNHKYIVSSMKASNIRMTMGTAVLNALHIKVTDEEGDPAPDQTIRVSTKNNMIIAPGWIEGNFLSEMKTNANGEFAGMLVSEYHPRSLDVSDNISDERDNEARLDTNHNKAIYNSSGVKPTIDELDRRITGEYPYKITIEVAGTTLEYYIDIDMGPVLVISKNSEPMFYSAQWIGMKTSKPIEMTLIYFKRSGECPKQNHMGNNQHTKSWLDEEFSLRSIRKATSSDASYNLVAERYDRNSHSIKLLDASTSTHEQSKNTKNIRPMRNIVEMDHVMGEILVTYTIPEISINYEDQPCFNNNLHTTRPQEIITKKTTYTVINTIPLYGASPRVSITVQDYKPPSPDNDPLPQVNSYSGVNVDKLLISLNNKVVFGNNINEIDLGQYPNYAQALADNVNLAIINKDITEKLAPETFEFIYHPTFDEIKIGQTNTVKATGIEDRVGNKRPDKVSTFTVP